MKTMTIQRERMVWLDWMKVLALWSISVLEAFSPVVRAASSPHIVLKHPV